MLPASGAVLCLACPLRPKPPLARYIMMPYACACVCVRPLFCAPREEVAVALHHPGFVRVHPSSGVRWDAQDFIDACADDDALVCGAACTDAELAYEDAHGATFEAMEFRGVVFDHVDFHGCTFRDVLFRDCRFTSCTMEGAWLSRVDVRDCSAPGLSLLRARLANVFMAGTDLSWANLSETSIDCLALHGVRLREAALQRSRMKRVELDACDLTRLDVFGTSLAGIDVSRCIFQAPVLSDRYRELRGAIVSPEQAVELALLLGVRLAEE